MERRRPYVVINVAATVDGKIDTRARRGTGISSDTDRRRVDELRASVDAIMVGGRTLHDEDPRLTVKSAGLRAQRVLRGQTENPAKVGVASRLNLMHDARFLTTGPSRVVIFVPSGQNDSTLAARGVEIYEIGEGRVDLTGALGVLAETGVQRLLVEGGGSLNFELLRLQVVDEVQVFIAPVIFGGRQAPTLADGEGLEQALELSRVSVECFDDGGVLLTYRTQASGRKR